MDITYEVTTLFDQIIRFEPDHQNPNSYLLTASELDGSKKTEPIYIDASVLKAIAPILKAIEAKGGQEKPDV